MEQNQLKQLGDKVIQLSKVFYGNRTNPFERVNDIARDTGIDRELILLALYTTKDGDKHEASG